MSFWENPTPVENTETKDKQENVKLSPEELAKELEKKQKQRSFLKREKSEPEDPFLTNFEQILNDAENKDSSEKSILEQVDPDWNSKENSKPSLIKEEMEAIWF